MAGAAEAAPVHLSMDVIMMQSLKYPKQPFNRVWIISQLFSLIKIISQLMISRQTFHVFQKYKLFLNQCQPIYLNRGWERISAQKWDPAGQTGSLIRFPYPSLFRHSVPLSALPPWFCGSFRVGVPAAHKWCTVSAGSFRC